MIVWNGLGILVPVIAFATLLLTQAVADAVTGVEGFYTAHSSLQAAALLSAAAVIWFLGRYLNGKPGRRLVDKATGEEFVVRPHHALFWVKMEYWAVVLVLAAFAAAFL